MCSTKVGDLQSEVTLGVNSKKVTPRNFSFLLRFLPTNLIVHTDRCVSMKIVSRDLEENSYSHDVKQTVWRLVVTWANYGIRSKRKKNKQSHGEASKRIMQKHKS